MKKHLTAVGSSRATNQKSKWNQLNVVSKNDYATKLCRTTFLRVLLMGAITTFGSSSLFAQTTLSVGDIKIVGYNADAPDGFSFVLLRDVAAGTSLKFTDGGFNAANQASATAFRSTESGFYLSFTGAAAAGTVVRAVDNQLTGSSAATILTPSAGYTSGFTGQFGVLSGLAAAGDQIFVYQGAGVPTATMTTTVAGWNTGAFNNAATSFSGTLVEGLTFRGTGATTSWLTTGSAGSNTSYLPNSLNVADANLAIGAALSTHGRYNGVITGLTSDAYAAAISSGTNWVTANTNTILTTTGFTIATSANLSWDANGNTAGAGGTGTWDSSTVNRFSDSTGTTFLRWVDSAANNSHTAVFGGIAGTVSVAASGVTASGLDFQTTGYEVNSNTITLTGTTPTINTASSVVASVGSVIAGTSGLTKTGTGSLTLSGTNTYTGATNVSQGTLNLAGGVIGNSAVTVASGSTLTGSGSAALANTVTVNGTLTGEGNYGATTIAATGILSPSSSISSAPSDIKFTSLTMADGATFNWDLASNTVDASPGNFDMVTLTGASKVLTIGSAAPGTVTSNLTFGSGVDFTQPFWGSNKTWNVFTGATSLAYFEPIGISAPGFDFSKGTLSWVQAGNDVNLQFTAVPEPTSLVFGLGLGVAGIVAYRRRKAKAASQSASA
jgi:autotransporter-associated beta strand protein